jgi:DNA-binding response OmpR family regulator
MTSDLIPVPAPLAPTPTLGALVVEDDNSISHLLVFMLERQGFKVHLCEDGRAAQKYIEANTPPDIVILDVSLPFVDGFSLIRIIRDRSAWATTPIIMLTAQAQRQDVAKALRAGANDYLLKPFHPAELLSRVQKLCAQKTLSEQPAEEISGPPEAGLQATAS